MRPAWPHLADGDDAVPRCLGCDYPLLGVEEEAVRVRHMETAGKAYDIPIRGDSQCPECGRLFNAGNPATYQIDEAYDWRTQWLPWVVISALFGVGWMIALYSLDNLGCAIFLAVPLGIGASVGYISRVSSGTWKGVAMTLGIMVLGAAVSGGLALSSTHLAGFAGIFCLLMIALIFAGPILLGLVVGGGLGMFVRWRLRKRRRREGIMMRLGAFLLIWLLPAATDLGERVLAPAVVIETVTTSAVVNATPEQAWDAWLFYGDVEHDPPLLLRLGLPTPVETRGRIHHEGDRQLCIYTKGHLVKQATHVERGRRLTFNVVEQVNIEDRSIRLIDGSFDFEDLGSGRTRVILTTRYEPLLRPRTLWAPIEHTVASTMHRHVLRGMELRLDRGEAATLSGGGVG